MSGAAPLVQASELTQRFGRQLVLRSVNLDVHAGERLALLGANGAGKTTLLRVLATLSRPTRGRYLAFGTDAFRARRAVRSRIGVVGHQPYVYPELSCRENLRFFATMHRISNADGLITNALEGVGLGSRADSAAGTLSRGLLQRLDLARATLHGPGLLILDEPDTGLDAPGRLVLNALMAEQIERGGAVIFTTHAIERAVRIATRVVVLERGTVTLDADTSELDVASVERAVSPVELAHA